MAQRKKPKKQPRPVEPKRAKREGSLALSSRNILLLSAGIIIIAIGYFLLGKGSITAAPLLLVLGYCVVVPLSIILWVKRPDSQNQKETGE